MVSLQIQMLHCKNYILIQVLLSTWWKVQTKYLPVLAWMRKFCSNADFCVIVSSCQLIEQCKWIYLSGGSRCFFSIYPKGIYHPGQTITFSPWMLNHPVIWRQTFQQKNLCWDDCRFSGECTFWCNPFREHFPNPFCFILPEYNYGILHLFINSKCQKLVLLWVCLIENRPNSSGSSTRG